MCVYGHLDVQPAALEDGWDSEPFTLVEREGETGGLPKLMSTSLKSVVFLNCSKVVPLIERGKKSRNRCGCLFNAVEIRCRRGNGKQVGLQNLSCSKDLFPFLIVQTIGVCYLPCSYSKVLNAAFHDTVCCQKAF